MHARCDLAPDLDPAIARFRLVGRDAEGREPALRHHRQRRANCSVECIEIGDDMIRRHDQQHVFGLGGQRSERDGGAVLRATGSSTSAWGGVPASVNWLSTKSAWRCPATTIGAAKSLDLVRCAVNCSIVSSEVSGNSCLGISGFDIGQRRVPEPPDRMTGTIGLCMNALLIVRATERYVGGQDGCNAPTTHIFTLRLSLSAKLGQAATESGVAYALGMSIR